MSVLLITYQCCHASPVYDTDSGGNDYSSYTDNSYTDYSYSDDHDDGSSNNDYTSNSGPASKEGAAIGLFVYGMYGIFVYTICKCS